MAKPKQTKAAECPNAHFHRAGAYCKTCGKVTAGEQTKKTKRE